MKHLVIAFTTLLSIQLAFSNSSKDWAKSAQSTIYEVSVILDRATNSLENYAKKAPSAITTQLSKSTTKLAGMFGVFGAIFSIILAFIPGSESPEMKLMKSEFGKLSEKVDTIARSLEDTKELIKVEAQRAVYIQHESKIHHGYSQLLRCLKKLDNVACSDLKECERKKALVAEEYTKSMNVLEHVEAILRGVATDSTFGDSLLDLLKEESECNVPKINLFANKVTALLAKGMTVSIFYDLLHKVDYNVLDGTVLADKMLRTLESRRQSIQHQCFSEINYWMPLDIKNSHEYFSSDTKATNTQLLKMLKNKYPWIWWHVITYKSKKKPESGPKSSHRRLLYSSSKVREIQSFVIPTNIAKVRNMPKKMIQWRKVVASLRYDAKNGVQHIESKLKTDFTLKNQIQSFAILSGEKWVFGHYEQEIRQQSFGSGEVYGRTRNVYVNRPRSGFIVVVSFIQSDYSKSCSEPCNGKGKCYVYPYSIQTGCRCKAGYGGEKCGSLGTSLKLKSVINAMVQKTMKLPTFASIQHSIQDSQLYLKTSTENIQKTIMKLGERIDEQFKNLGEFMSNKFKWYDTLSKYKDAIENLNYFHSISSTKITQFHQNTSIAKLKDSSLNTKFLMAEDKEIARFLLSPTGIRKWLYQINFLIVGRRDSQFNSHKALVFMVMDKHKHLLCSRTYQIEITRTYRQLMLMQLQGYMLWSNAYSIVNRDSSIISDSYTKVLKNQQTYLKGATCAVALPHSKNMHNCTGGYYIHQSMRIDMNSICNDGYFTKG